MIGMVGHQEFPVPCPVGRCNLQAILRSFGEPGFQLAAQAKETPATGTADVKRFAVLVSQFIDTELTRSETNSICIQ